MTEVKIGENKTGLIIGNGVDGLLHMEFGCGFYIKLNHLGVTICRDRLRPSHDHSDEEMLCIDKILGGLSWRTYQELGGIYERLEIPFGSVTVEY